jgi:hypothetical protein
VGEEDAEMWASEGRVATGGRRGKSMKRLADAMANWVEVVERKR